jgi:hypothetical protein
MSKYIKVFESARLLVVKSIPEVGFSAAHKPLYAMIFAEKFHEIIQIFTF